MRLLILSSHFFYFSQLKGLVTLTFFYQMKIILFLIAASFLFLQNGFAQKKKEMAYFSREVTIKDSITLSIVDRYIDKVQKEKEKVVHVSIAAVKDTIYYHFEAIATFEMVTDYCKPFFLFEHKGYYFLIDNGMGRMFQGNEQFARYITKKLKKHLVPSHTEKDEGEGAKLVTELNFDPPVMFATYSRGGVQIKWNGL
jgi:hypothetical protein